MAKKVVKSTALTGEVIDVGVPESPELALMRADASPVQQFTLGVAQFVQDVKALEDKARTDLEAAKTWKLPTSKVEDEELVARIRQNTAETKTVEDKWQITTIISRFHKRLTAKRGVALELRQEVANIGNRLHNQFKDAEERRVREENDRLRREAEERARKDREAELAELERKAVEAEANSPVLSERETRFVDYYTGPYRDAARAAQQAGYKDPDKAALRLLSTPKIAAAITAKREAIAIREQAQARQSAPVERTDFVPVKAEAAKGDRTTWSAEIFDVDAFIGALLDPMTRTRCGIPAEIAIEAIKRAIKLGNGSLPELNTIATTLHENIDRWPGVRHKKTTKVVG